MDPSDPYYLGELPGILAFVLGVGLICLIGWAVDKVKKQ